MSDTLSIFWRRRPESGRATGVLFRKIRDIALVGSAAIITVAALIYPVVQIVAILACAIALLFGADAPPLRRSFETASEAQLIKMTGEAGPGRRPRNVSDVGFPPQERAA